MLVLMRQVRHQKCVGKWLLRVVSGMPDSRSRAGIKIMNWTLVRDNPSPPRAPIIFLLFSLRPLLHPPGRAGLQPGAGLRGAGEEGGRVRDPPPHSGGRGGQSGPGTYQLRPASLAHLHQDQQPEQQHGQPGQQVHQHLRVLQWKPRWPPG